MNVTKYAERNRIWPRFRRAMVTLWLPLFMLAVIPTTITLAANLPFAVNFFSAILPLFGVAAYLAYSRYGVTGLLSIAGVFGLGLLYKLLNSIFAVGPIAPTIPTGHRINGPDTASLVTLIAMIILFGGAAYFTGRLYEKTGTGMVTVIVVIVLVGLTLGGVSLGWS
jgi:hypothetical protein